MSKVAVTYKGFFLTPLAAFDEGSYAAMVIVERPDHSEKASGVLGHLPIRMRLVVAQSSMEWPRLTALFDLARSPRASRKVCVSWRSRIVVPK